MKDKKLETLLYSSVGAAVVFGIVVAVNLIGSSLKVRLDMTGDKLYTLADGTKRILGKLDAPVEVRFYCSESEANMPTQFRGYARHVDDLLREFRRASKGMLQIKKFDPQPDSDAEDMANQDGIEPQALPTGDRCYLGVAISQDPQKVALPFLSPDRERLLEYDLARAITRVQNTAKAVIGIMSPLPIFGAPMNPMMMQQMGRQQKQDPWYIIEELKRDFEVKQVNMDLDKIDDEVKVLMVIHPKEITDKAQFAIDQFIMRGGKLIAFLDAMSMVDSRGNNPMMQMPGGGSTLDKLIKAWGITFDNTKVVADHNLMWRGVNQQGAPDVQPAVLALTKKAINADDSATAQMDNVMMLFAGSFGGEPVSGLKKTVLLQSTADSQLIDGMTAQFSAQKIVEDFKSSGTKQALAIRLAGKFKTAFPDGRPDDKKDDADKKDEKKEDKKAGLLTECKQDNAVVLVGDADMLYDAFCVQVQNVFGQKIAIPRNSNLNLAQNLVEEMAGDSNLIGTRSRGTLNRPFTVVREMQAKAERKWQDELGKLEKQHQEVQTKISELQAKKEGSQRFILSKEQQEEITKLRTEQAKAGKRLKEVRKELRQDIDSLETRLKWLNIISIPVAVAIVGIVFAVIRNKRRSAK